MKKSVAYHDFPREAFPLKLEALHPKTRAVVWSQTVDAPPPGVKWALEIPPLRKLYGLPVVLRVTYGDGTVEEAEYGLPS